MHGMTNSESAREDFFIKILGQYRDPSPRPDNIEHEDSHRGKLFDCNDKKLFIATYNCFIFSVECIVRLYNGVI